MQSRKHAEKSARTKKDVESQESDERHAAANKLIEEMDEILDDIDAVLEENAQEFVNSYVQIGGE